jgi:peptidoglycan lytic transglycosylase G
MADPRERTPEERETARRERERRRYGAGPAEPMPGSDGAEAAASPNRPRLARPDPRGPRPGQTGVRASRPPWPARAQSEGPPPTHSRRRRIFAVIALAVAVVLVWFLVELFQPFHGSGHGSVTVVIPPHSSVSKVGDLLENDGVISSSFFFQLRATLSGDRGDLRAGTYHLKKDMSYGSVLSTLTKAPPPVPTTGLTITPGRARRQIAALLRAEGVSGSYYSATRSSPLLNPSLYGAPRGTNSLEGFLFPDTYELREPVSVSALVADQLTDFKRQFATVDLRYAHSQHLSAYDVLIAASMIEGEAQKASDRALVAAVIYNRLRLGMPLQIDATTRYATNNYTGPLTTAELDSPSPYNTRIHTGLPPTPIGNPGLAAIQAAAHPAHTNYLYFVVLPCGNGKEVFDSSYQQFLRDSERYQAARTQHGGRSPAHC